MCKDTRERKCFTLHRWKVAIRKMLEENAQQIELLSVEAPEIDHRTDQGNACIHLKTGNSVIMMIIIRGLVFDTTVSNTGLKTGACALLEQMHLVWTAHSIKYLKSCCQVSLQLHQKQQMKGQTLIKLWLISERLVVHQQRNVYSSE